MAITAIELRGEDWRPNEPNAPSEWYGQTIRETAWRTPQLEQQGFHVPRGFAIELVASEPVIAKPMNLAFDPRGRLWVSQSLQYPFPATDPAAARDSIAILEDRNKDGSFESHTLFADGLNIPIGVLPYEDGAIAFSIPNIWRLRDRNGDGVCDDREVLLGPFDTSRDTHGMVNALRDGGDGWIYACHGFNNISKISGTDGHAIELTSGNVFRFRPDGSRVEQFTQGQVNPFGMARDAYGNWFTADCHSKPISQLLRGGCYPSFGRPDDGLGFVPPMMDHLHGSTAISGLACVDEGTYPEAFHGNLLSGNVMTCRINRNRLEYHGATAKAIEMPDLLTSEDPWFRPVDLQFGPDNCLYVADFYNKIIGHYEVPLDHPDRDRTSGRIWRIRWSGSEEQAVAPKRTPNATMDTKVLDVTEALKLLKSPHDLSDTAVAMQRVHAIEVLGDNADVRAIESLMMSVRTIDEAFDPVLRQAHWIAMRDILRRAVGDRVDLPEAWLDQGWFVASAQDMVRVLRSLRDPIAAHWSVQIIEAAGERLPESWNTSWLEPSLLDVATVASEADISRVLTLLERIVPNAGARESQLLAIAEAQLQRNGRLSTKLVGLGETAVMASLQSWIDSPQTTSSRRDPLHRWTSIPMRPEGDARPWSLESRSLRQNDGGSLPTSVWSSFGLGEPYTGSWISSSWKAPGRLSFWIVGHNGLPTEPDSQRNYVRLLKQNSATRDWSEVVRYFPPRSDVGTRIELDLTQHEGSKMRFQVVDGDDGGSYAWIAIGDVSMSGLKMGKRRDAYDRLEHMVRIFGPSITESDSPDQASELLSRWSELMQSTQLDPACKVSLQKGMFGAQYPVVSELVELVVAHGWEDLLTAEPTPPKSEANRDHETSTSPLPKYSWDWSELNPRTVLWIAENYCLRSSASDQEALTRRWSRHRASLPLLETLLRGGVLSKEVLRSLPPAWWESLSPEESSRLSDLRPEGESDAARGAIVQLKAAAVEGLVPDLVIGARVFQERCSVCHQLAGQGKLVGPQLDGAITRTIERLCEDILWPNRNVDEAFRVTNLRMTGGETWTGLVVDRQKDTLELIEPSGKAQRIARDEIEEEKVSKLSLMPGSFEELLSDAELASLLGYLKSQTPVAPAAPIR